MALVSAALSMKSEYYYSKKGGYWKDKNGKYRSTDWGGNGATGGKFKYGKATGTFLNRTGGALGLYGIYSTDSEWRAGNITAPRMVQDQAFNMGGYLGAPGAAASFGYTSGSVIEDWCNCNIQVNWGNVRLYGTKSIPMWFEPLKGRDY